MMPVFKFTSPQGNDYYGEGATPQEAFQSAEERDPHEIAAMRTRQSVVRGAAPANPEIPEAAEAVKRGDYGPLRETAFSSANALAGAAVPFLNAAEGVLAPSATAGGLFDMEADPKKRKALEKQYSEATPRGKQQIIAAFNADQAKIQEEIRKTAAEEKATKEGKQRRTDWEEQNAEAISKLPQTDRDTIKGAGSLPEAQSLFAQAMERRRQAGMTLAERYPAGVLAAEGLAVAGDVYAPLRIASGRASALSKSADAAQSALRNYRVPRANAVAQGEASTARNILQENVNLPRLEPSELALGAAVPYVAGNIPNGIDMLMGMLSSDPAAREKVQKAWDSATDPVQFFRSIATGLGATAVGSFAGGAVRDIGKERARGRGILSEYEARDTAAASKASAAEARKKELADAKKAAAEARKTDREGAAADRERVAQGDISKTLYANAAPKPATPLQAAAEAAEAEKAQAAAQRRAIRALKPKGSVSPLAPGAGAAGLAE